MALDMSDPEVKAAVEAMVDDAVSGLKAKNVDLASRLEKARAGKSIDPDDYRALEEKSAKLESDLAAANKVLKTSGVELEKIKKAYDSESRFSRQLLVDNGLVDALTKAGVTNPISLKAAKAMLKDQVELIIEGESRKAMIGDKDLTTAIKDWAGGDEGKHFIAAPANSGGGATGSGNGGATGKTASRAAYEGMNPIERASFMKDGGKLVE